MVPSEYSFIDIAVLEEVRLRFVAGDALAILSADLETVIWANGAGAALFGHADIESVMGAPSGLGFAGRRQVAAAPGYPDITPNTPLTLRLARGTASAAVAFQAGGLVLPDGEKAILLAAPAPGSAGRGAAEIAARTIAGFSEAGYHAALVDADSVLAATPGFDDLAIDEDTIARLVGEVAGERDRLVKRLIPAAGGRIPAAIARLGDQPLIHLLVAIDEIVAETADLQDSSVAIAGGQDEASSPEAIPATQAGTSPSTDMRQQADAEDAAPPQAVTLPAGPLRFVWRTDADGRFSHVSPEFLDAVGLPADEYLGRPFRDVLTALGLDPSGEIGGLIEHRDTWSGRTVMWPLGVSGNRVPVDLAALPAYSRDRSFEGFRGFGVAHFGDVREATAIPAIRPADSGESATEAVPNAGPVTETETPDTPVAVDEEVPVVSVEPTGERRQSDKIIRLAEHRATEPAHSLSPVERSAFREIGDRLKSATSKDIETETADDPGTAGAAVGETFEPEAGETPAEVAVGMAGDADAPASEPIATENAAAEAEAAITDASVEETFAPEAEETPTEKAVGMAGDAGAPAPEAVAVADTSGDLPTAGARPSSGEPAATAETEPGPAESAADPEKPAEPPTADADLRGWHQAAIIPSAFATSDTVSAEISDRQFVAGLPIPLLVHNGDRLHFANEEFHRLTGYGTLDELEAAGGLEALFVDPETADEEGGRITRPGTRVRGRDGQVFEVRAHLQSIPWEGGNALLLSMLRQPEPQADSPAMPPPAPEETGTADLNSDIEEMRTILDTATDGVILIGENGAIRSVNSPAEALFGFEAAELTDRPFTSLFAVESQRIARDYLNGLAENGVASVLNDGREVIGREAQGRFIPLFMTIGRLAAGRGYCAVVRDITQWKRAEEELTQARALAERSSSQKTDFLARVSHEIRTPLNAIIGFSELMIDEKFGPIGNDRYRDYLRDINRSGNHVLDLVNDLLDISKIEAGEQEMSYEAVSLNDTLAETVAMMQPQANRERVIIRSSFASRLPEIVADLRSIRQIALNLLSNAIRFTQPGGQVIVSTAYDLNGEVVMRVRDTGVGMSAAEIEQALKPFKQIKTLKRTRMDGTGLGLPLTKAMVEANRARFAINSTPGEGTIVEIAFPSTRVLAD